MAGRAALRPAPAAPPLRPRPVRAPYATRRGSPRSVGRATDAAAEPRVSGVAVRCGRREHARMCRADFQISAPMTPLCRRVGRSGHANAGPRASSPDPHLQRGGRRPSGRRSCFAGRQTVSPVLRLEEPEGVERKSSTRASTTRVTRSVSLIVTGWPGTVQKSVHKQFKFTNIHKISNNFIKISQKFIFKKLKKNV